MFELNEFIRFPSGIGRIVYIKVRIQDSENDYSQYVVDNGKTLSILYENQMRKIE
jgi:hypothetical protein